MNCRAFNVGVLLGLMSVISMMAPIAALADTTVLDAAHTSAQQTQKQCQMLLHHDADEYVECVDALLLAHPKADGTRLGIEYFGFVGALNSARMSFLGANEAADRYLRQFRKTQRRLKIKDDLLCATIPGDCVQRLARQAQMEALPRVPPDRYDPIGMGKMPARQAGAEHKHD